MENSEVQKVEKVNDKVLKAKVMKVPKKTSGPLGRPISQTAKYKRDIRELLKYQTEQQLKNIFNKLTKNKEQNDDQTEQTEQTELTDN